MDLAPEFSAALGRVAGRLNRAQVRYQLGGSCLIRLSGHDVPVSDIDLVLPAEERERFDRACGSWQPEFFAGGPEPWNSAWRARWRLGDTPIEAIGGLAIRIDGVVTRMPFEESGLYALVEGELIPLAPIDQWRRIYQAHRPETAALLES